MNTVQMKNRIELLYFEGCPSWKNALAELEAVLEDQGLSGSVDLVRVDTDADAKAHRFVGSPTIRINGENLFPVDHANYALGCRVYTTPDGMRGWPTESMIREALSERAGFSQLRTHST